MGQKGILVLSHGSRREEASHLVTNLVARLRADLESDLVEPAFFQLAIPDIPTALAKLVSKGCREIVVFSLFLVNGNHLAKDVPALITDHLSGYDGVSFTLTPPLLQSPELYSLILERLQPEAEPREKALPRAPAEIEATSFGIIRERLGAFPLSPGESSLVQRVIHATADFSYASTLRFNADPVTRAVEAVRRNCSIIVDTNMVKSGITRHYPGQVLCQIDEMSELAAQRGLTKASLAMEQLADRMEGALVAIGNAPTALFKVVELVATGQAKPAVVIGVPVGLVGALEAKFRLAELKEQPHITNLSRKGGSAVAASLVNAIIKLAAGDRAEIPESRGVEQVTSTLNF
jgi:precorrin-8X/cobalt-precorrin-8 methylmutase